MRSFFEKKIQFILNHSLALDPESIHRINALKNHIISIELNGLAFVFQLIFTESTILFKTQDFEKPNTIIKGTPLSLLHMTLSSNRKKFFADDNIIIEGDIETGQHIIDLFDQFEIDWEEYISRITGDIPAHQIYRALSHVKQLKRRLQTALTQNINEYIHEEKNLFPTSEALQDFFREVDLLRMDTDRLEARIARFHKGI